MMKKCLLLIMLIGMIGLVPMTTAQTETPTPPVPPEAVDFVWWQDLNEGAFATQIPLGWQVTGSMSDIFGIKSLSINVTSPDNRNFIGIGTTPIEWGILLTPEMEAEGWTDGDIVAGDTGFFIAISPFRTGSKAAQLLAEVRVMPNCENYETTNTYDYEREEVDGIIYSPGEIQFKCTLNDVTYSGYYYAVTVAYPIAGIGTIWTLDTLYAIFVLPNNLPIVANVLQYMLDTTHFNPAWVENLSEPDPNSYATIHAQVEDDALFNDIVSQIINLSHQRMTEYVADTDGIFEFDYEFLPLP